MIALECESRIALEDEYFVKRKLYPNVDFYNRVDLPVDGISTTMFPVLFAISADVPAGSHSGKSCCWIRSKKIRAAPPANFISWFMTRRSYAPNRAARLNFATRGLGPPRLKESGRDGGASSDRKAFVSLSSKFPKQYFPSVE